jgi:hypothetical protein
MSSLKSLKVIALGQIQTGISQMIKETDSSQTNITLYAMFVTLPF